MPLKITTEEELPVINLTPMIDVVFLLIIFFMVGTQFNQQERQVDIQLPGVGTLNPMMPKPQNREVQISASGAAFLDGQPVTVLDLTRRLTEMRRQYPELSIAVRADAESRHKDLVPVYGAIKKAGVMNMSVLGIQNEKLR
jgi:biopolymer transport protein ExbD